MEQEKEEEKLNFKNSLLLETKKEEQQPLIITAEESDDDEAVVFKELAYNYAISSCRSSAKSKISGIFLSSFAKSEGVETESIFNQTFTSKSRLRECLTKAILEASKSFGEGQGQLQMLLSAKRNHINELSNEVAFLSKKIKELEGTIRVLTRINKRQEWDLKRFYDKETKMPILIEAHKQEIKILQDKLRRLNETRNCDGSRLKKLEAELLKAKDEVAKLKDTFRNKNLPERLVLQRSLEATLKEKKEMDAENQNLRKKMNLIEKSLTRKVNSEVSKHKNTLKKLEYLQKEQETILEKLAKKEKELNSLQQYRSRGIKYQASKNSSATNLSSTTSTTPPPRRRKKLNLKRLLSFDQRPWGKISAEKGVLSAKEKELESDILEVYNGKWTSPISPPRLPDTNARITTSRIPKKSESQLPPLTTIKKISSSSSGIEMSCDDFEHPSDINKKKSHDAKGLQKETIIHRSPSHSSSEDVLSTCSIDELSTDTTKQERKMQTPGELSLIEHYPPKERRNLHHQRESSGSFEIIPTGEILQSSSDSLDQIIADDCSVSKSRCTSRQQLSLKKKLSTTQSSEVIIQL